MSSRDVDFDATLVPMQDVVSPPPSDGASRRARRLDRVAAATFDELFVESYDRLVRSVTAVCGDRELAADCVADAFERAYVRWWRVGRYDDPVGWVRRVAINRATDAHRRRVRQGGVLHRLTGQLADAPAAESEANLGADPALVRAVRSLSARQREVALAFYVEEQSVAEIAATLGLTDGAVKFHLHQARTRLRDLLAIDPLDGKAV